MNVKGKLAEIAAALSIFRNAKKIFHVTKNADHFDCLNAIRVISITWVIVGHTYLESMGVASIAFSSHFHEFITL